MVEGLAIRRTNSGAGTIRRSSVKDKPRDNNYYIEDGYRAAILSVFIVSKEERPRRCFLCVGLVFRLEPGNPCIEALPTEVPKKYLKGG